MTTIWDPLRRKDVALTPEEQVRQWFIANLRDSLGVPVHMMGSEVSFEFGRKPYRADIVVFSRSGSPSWSASVPGWRLPRKSRARRCATTPCST